jgi:hypothetical protein
MKFRLSMGNGDLIKIHLKTSGCRFNTQVWWMQQEHYHSHVDIANGHAS